MKNGSKLTNMNTKHYLGLNCKTNKGDSKMVESLFCELCKKYEDNFCGMQNFAANWVNGSTDLKQVI